MNLGIKIVLKMYELLILLVLVSISAPIYFAVNYNVLIDRVKTNGILTVFGLAVVAFAPLLLLQHQIMALLFVLVSGIFLALKRYDDKQTREYKNHHEL